VIVEARSRAEAEERAVEAGEFDDVEIDDDDYYDDDEETFTTVEGSSLGRIDLSWEEEEEE
jgi:hypothetical protein